MYVCIYVVVGSSNMNLHISFVLYNCDQINDICNILIQFKCSDRVQRVISVAITIVCTHQYEERIFCVCKPSKADYHCYYYCDHDHPKEEVEDVDCNAETSILSGLPSVSISTIISLQS